MRILVVVLSAWLAGQAAQPPDSFETVRQMVADARTAVETFERSPAAGAEHPAVTWDRALWAVHERDPRGRVGALAAVEAVRLLVQADMWPRVEARTASLAADDPAWEGLPPILYTAAIRRNKVPDLIATLARVADAAPGPSTKAAALLIVGRAYRRQGDLAAATRALEAARAAAPASSYAEEAKGVVYEIEFLTPGKTAPAISTRARNGRTIDLAALRGRPVVLVFWGTT